GMMGSIPPVMLPLLVAVGRGIDPFAVRPLSARSAPRSLDIDRSLKPLPLCRRRKRNSLLRESPSASCMKPEPDGNYCHQNHQASKRALHVECRTVRSSATTDWQVWLLVHRLHR